jgi:hypothetical protein
MKNIYMLKVEILFFTIINMMIIFHFIFLMLKNPILIVYLSISFLNASTCTRCLILENGLHVDEFLFSNFQISRGLKTYLCIVKLCML